MLVVIPALFLRFMARRAYINSHRPKKRPIGFGAIPVQYCEACKKAMEPKKIEQSNSNRGD